MTDSSRHILHNFNFRFIFANTKSDSKRKREEAVVPASACDKEGAFMHISTTLQPGQRGAKKFLAQYGDRLVCVRYRQDQQRQKRFKTVELIVAEWPWTPLPPRRRRGSIVFVKV